MEIKHQTRELQIPLTAINTESRTIDIAFCSELPVEREINGQIYNEILLCGVENVDLRRMTSGSGPVLYNHNRDDLIGVVESAHIDGDRVGRATVRISSTANDEWEMIQEGILTNVSIGYNINNYRIDGNNIYVTDFEIYEISLVTVPADPSVGIGRSLESDPINNNNGIIQGNLNMEDENKIDEVVETTEVIAEEEVVQEVVDSIEDELVTETRSIESNFEEKLKEHSDKILQEIKKQSTEENRVNELRSIGEVLNIDVNEAIENGISITDFKRQLKEKENTPVINKEVKTMEEKNLLKDTVRAIKTGDESVFEKYERGERGFVRAVVSSTNTTTAAGAVNEELQDQYIPELLKVSTLGQLNPTVYSGLYGRGNFAIPKASGVSPIFRTYSEGETQDDSIASFTKVTMSPQAFGGAIPLSKVAILTAPHIENFVQNELIRYAAQGLEQWVMDKIAAAAPSVTTADGATLTLADVENAVALLGAANVNVRATKAVMNSKTVAALRQVLVLDNTAAKAMIEGYRATEMWLADEVEVVVSEFVDDNVILIGDFTNVLIADWEGQEIDFDQTTYRSSQTVVYRVWNYLDVAVAHSEAFVKLNWTPA